MLGRKDLAGKTGTTNENVDAWFCGYNSAQVGIAWIGFDQPRTLGTTRPAAWLRSRSGSPYMQKALKGVPEQPASRPRGSVPLRINADTGLRDDSSNESDWFLSEFLPRQREEPLAPVSVRPADRRRTYAISCSEGEEHTLTFRRRRLPRNLGTAVAFRVAKFNQELARRPYGASFHRGGTDPSRDDQNRARIAQVAARLIAEHGITDWSLAKRKAARELMLPDREPLPRRRRGRSRAGRVPRAVRWRSPRGVAARPARARLALDATPGRVPPMLVGGVAAGWATEHSDIRIELVADDPKTVELALINADVAYRTLRPPATTRSRIFISTPRRRRSAHRAQCARRPAETAAGPQRPA